jgi:hypothetical protein
MPPTPSPRPDEIETARKMCGEPSYAIIEARVNALSDAGWAAAVDDIDEYRGVERKRVEVGGEVELRPSRTRAELRRDMRVRLGFDPRTDDQRESLLLPPSVVVGSRVRW